MILISTQSAVAGWLDDDDLCKKHGCVVVHDGSFYEIYDNYDILADKCCVPKGGQMLPRSEVYGGGGFRGLNMTDTLNMATTPDDTQSLRIGITEDGKRIFQSSLDDNGNGFLDMDDTFQAFALTPDTDLILDDNGRSYSHSFFITSYNTKFSMRAAASKTTSSGELGNIISLDNIKLTPKISKKGEDGTFKYGKQAKSKKIKINKKIDDLGDIEGVSQELISFEEKKGVRKKKGDIDEQSIRLDFLYQLPPYDMSMGTGKLHIDVAFSFYRDR